MFLFNEVYKETIWGGDRIASLKGSSPTLHRIGESWELSGIPGHETLVSEGPDKGKSLSELAAEYGASLLGRHVYDQYGTDFPLLVKFIDAHAGLSIQVHPDDLHAQSRHGSNGKTEMWYVVDSSADGRLLVGFDHAMSAEEYDASVAHGDIANKVRSHNVKSGDVFFLPPGRIHAACAGVLLAEIQQSSDITYRIYDYGRKGQDGNPRELHHKEAREVLDFTSLSDYRTHYTTQANKPSRLAACQYFSTEILDLSQTTELDVTPLDSFCILICVDGEAEVDQRDGLQPQTARLKKGHTLLLPANATNVVLTPLSSSKLLQVWVP